jgi:hypothetical protein
MVFARVHDIDVALSAVSITEAKSPSPVITRAEFAVPDEAVASDDVIVGV